MDSAQVGNLTFFRGLSLSEKLSEIKPPLVFSIGIKENFPFYIVRCATSSLNRNMQEKLEKVKNFKINFFVQICSTFSN